MAPQISSRICPLNRKRRILEYLDQDENITEESIKTEKEIEILFKQIMADSADVTDIPKNPINEDVISLNSASPPAKRQKLSDANTKLPKKQVKYVFKNGIVSEVTDVLKNPTEADVDSLASAKPPAKRQKLSHANTKLPKKQVKYVFKNGIVSEVTDVLKNPTDVDVVSLSSASPPVKRQKLSDVNTVLSDQEVKYEYVYKNGIVSCVPVRKPKQNLVFLQKKPVSPVKQFVSTTEENSSTNEDHPAISDQMGEESSFSENSANDVNENSSSDDFQHTPISNPDGVIIGPGGTVVGKNFFAQIDWSLSAAIVTRKLLMEVFGRAILSTHSLSGKPSPAFLTKPTKEALDSVKVADIVFLVTTKKNVKAKEVRLAITSKCADEQKMLRNRKPKAKLETISE